MLGRQLQGPPNRVPRSIYSIRSIVTQTKPRCRSIIYTAIENIDFRLTKLYIYIYIFFLQKFGAHHKEIIILFMAPMYWILSSTVKSSCSKILSLQNIYTTLFNTFQKRQLLYNPLSPHLIPPFLPSFFLLRVILLFY